jgi:hypothetical protein
MRYSLLVFSTVTALSLASEHAYAVQYQDYDVAVLSVVADMVVLAQQQKSTQDDVFDQCKFYRNSTTAWLTESMDKLKLYVDCPDEGPKVKELLASSEKFISALKVVGEKACADAGISPY